MKFFSAPASMLALVVVVAAIVFSPPLPVDANRAGAVDGKSLDAEAAAGAALAQKLGVHEVLGPLAPVAMSPFFALTFMSGASLMADTGFVPDSIANNALLGKGSPLNNGFVFAGLLGLTAVTALPKLTKVTKPFAQAIDQVEAHSGIVAMLAVQGLSRMRLGDEAGQEVANVVIQAGVWSFTVSTALMVFSAINIFVVNTVKFFFEMMIFLSPFPTVDAIFETANKAVTAALVSIYLWSPFIATVLNLTIFAISLLLFAWIHRRVVYLRSIFGDPLFGWLGRKFLRRSAPTADSTRLTGALAAAVPNPTLVIKAFAGTKFGGLPRKARGFLVQADGRLQFMRRRLFRGPQIVPLPSAGHSLRVEKGFLANSVVIENDAGDVAAKVLFTRRYNDALDEIRTRLGAASEAQAATEPTLATAGVLGVSRTIGEAVIGQGRANLRAELG